METPKSQSGEIPPKLDRYELQTRIGAGGMGLIYKGLDTRLKRPVAIKIISDRVQDREVRRNIRERFFNEARAAGGLSHPNLVQIYDCGEAEEFAYIVMEYIEGETLENLLKARGQLSLEDLLKISKEIANGLAFAHKKGIVHRDVKPSNVILEAHSGIAKILDFGIAKFVNEEEMKLTSTGMVLGSTHYLSPEHITGKNLDGRSDIFCLGTVLYEAATGSLPFRGNNSSSILYKIMNFDPQAVSEIRPELHSRFSTLIMKCLKKNPAERFQKCEEIDREILGIQQMVISERQANTSGPQPRSTQALKSYFVRSSQVLSLLQAEKKITTEQVTELRGRPSLFDLILRENLITEDELAKTIADCLDLSWIPRGRLKALKISDRAVKLLPGQVMREQNILPFFHDPEKKQVSVLIDGCSDFQKNPDFLEISQNIQIQFYVAGRATLQKLIDAKLRTRESSPTTGESPALVQNTAERLNTLSIGGQRVLLLDNQMHNREAVIKLFKRNENSLVIASELSEALAKIRKERFDYLWINRSLIGDELEFELLALKQNANAEIRYYDQLANELFEESIPYRKFSEFFNRVIQDFLTAGAPFAKTKAEALANFALRVAETATENRRVQDQVYASVLFWKWEHLTGNAGTSINLFDNICRLRHVFDCIGERFDGRGPLGLRDRQIPLASRLITALSLVDTIHPDHAMPWTETELNDLKRKFDHYSGKHLDPQIVSRILEFLRPQQKTKSAKIAIVDFDSAYSKNLAAHLSNISSETKIYADGLAALSGIKKDKPDLIISEVLLAKLDGFSLCARLQADQLLKSIPLVFLSESTTPEHSTKAIQLGAADFISKSSEPQFIIAKLERMLK